MENPSVFCTFDLEICFAPQRCALLNIASSKSAPRMVCFVGCYFEMCFPPQPRALFRRLNFQKRRDRQFLTLLTSKCASRHNGAVQFFTPHLARWLRTRRFREPTFRPSGAPSTFSTFSRACIFFLLTVSLL